MKFDKKSAIHITRGEISIEIMQRESIRRGHYMAILQILKQELEYIEAKQKNNPSK